MLEEGDIDDALAHIAFVFFLLETVSFVNRTEAYTDLLFLKGC